MLRKTMWLAALAITALVAGPAYPQTDPAELTFWESVRDSTDPTELEAYLSAYPSGTFAPLARIRLGNLTGAAEVGAPDGSATEVEQAPTAETVESAPPPAAEEVEGKQPKIVADRGTLGIEAKAAAGGAGVEITAVRPGRPASSGSLRTGDIIQKIGGEPVLTETSLQEQVAVKAPGEEVQVEVRRDGRALTVTVRVGSYAEHLLALAEEGDADAMMLVGEHLSDGAIFEKDAALAVVWFGRAREAWENRTALTPNACDRLAANPDDAAKVGDGVPFDELQADEAINACTAAVEAHPDAARFRYQLARAHQKAENYSAASAALGGLARQQYVPAMHNLGIIKYEQGDVWEAVRLYRMAADAGYPPAMTSLGRLYERGYGGTAEEAVRLYRRAAEAGDAAAMYALAGMYRTGKGVAKNGAEVVRWVRAAAEAGYAPAMFGLSYMLADGNGVTKNDVDSLRWLRAAAETGYSNAIYRLGIRYMDGQGVEKNEAEGVRLIKAAAEQNNRAAIHVLALCYDTGTVVEKNPQKAAELIFQTLQAGFAFSVEQLRNKPTTFSADFRREMQRLLKEAGVYDGPIDGDFGPGTKRAIEALASGG